MQANKAIEVSDIKDDYQVVEQGRIQMDGPRTNSHLKSVTVMGPKGKPVVLKIPRSLVPEVKRMYHPAFWNIETLDSPAGTVSAYSFIDKIAQGVTAAQRIGGEIRLHGLRINFFAFQSSGITSDTAVLQVIKDKQPAAGLPNWSDLFEPIGGGTDASAYTVAVPKYDTRKRFDYVDRRLLNSSWTAAYYNAGPTISIRHQVGVIEMKFNGAKIEYDPSLGVITKGFNVDLYGWGLQTSDTTRVTASYELFFEDA